LRQIEKDYAEGRILTSIRRQGSEEYLDWRIPLDLCFTSPPYLDTERYSDEETQSYIKYPTERQWYDGFLLDTLRRCNNSLKPLGHLVLNVSDKMESETIAKAIESGFWLKDRWRLLLSGRKTPKYEPILVFGKI
jgi:DNA modification methylase